VLEQKQLVIFKFGDDEFRAEIKKVQKVIRMSKTTRFPDRSRNTSGQFSSVAVYPPLIISAQLLVSGKT